VTVHLRTSELHGSSADELRTTHAREQIARTGRPAFQGPLCGALQRRSSGTAHARGTPQQHTLGRGASLRRSGKQRQKVGLCCRSIRRAGGGAAAGRGGGARRAAGTDAMEHLVKQSAGTRKPTRAVNGLTFQPGHWAETGLLEG
jgi:hypothetical protein